VSGLKLTVKDLVVSTAVALPLIHPVRFSLEPGQCLVIQGASGAGKSTLLSAIAGVQTPDLQMNGEIRLGDQCVSDQPAYRRRIGMLFQRPNLFAHLSVGQNVALVLAKQPGDSIERRRQRVEKWLDSVGLAGMMDRDPATLSGGQQARAALARMLAADPSAVLLDEPFSALDPPLRAATRALVYRHLAEANVPVVLVTHDSGDVPAQQFEIKMHHMSSGKLQVAESQRADH